MSLGGFADVVQQAVLLARQTVRINGQLALAGATEQVQVSAQTIIETSSATIDNTRSGDDINRLALNFRATSSTSPIVVATLAAGVQQDRGGAISVAGNLPFMTSFSIDGIASHSSRSGGAAREMFPSVESIEEFKVSSANNNAEFMQVTDITTTSKSGNNQLRGTAFWFINDSALSSVNRFAPKDAAGKAIKPDIRTNSFGASGGGPLSKNRTFFFGTSEGVREPNEATLSHVVPPDAFRSGDLSSITAAIRNPATGLPYANNQIPVHPSSAKILSAMYERQNQSTGAAINRPNYITNAPGNYAQNGFDARIDQQISDSLPSLKARLAASWPAQTAFGVHVLVSQHDRGELVLGDSHQYDAAITPFDRPAIDELVLEYLRTFVDVSHLEIAERWHGIYVKHPTEPYCVLAPEDGVTAVAALGGHGMTLSFGLAEHVVRQVLG